MNGFHKNKHTNTIIIVIIIGQSLADDDNDVVQKETGNADDAKPVVYTNEILAMISPEGEVVGLGKVRVHNNLI